LSCEGARAGGRAFVLSACTGQTKNKATAKSALKGTALCLFDLTLEKFTHHLKL
jgi:hypothetical protein